jgi:hypothetical protein
MEPVTKFVHTALFKSESGWNELHIKITFNGRYTIIFTKRGPDYEEEVSSIKDMLYFPDSTIKMISTTGENVFSSLDYLCNLLTKLCTETIQSDVLKINEVIEDRINVYVKKNEILEATLEKTMLEIVELREMLALANKQYKA